MPCKVNKELKSGLYLFHQKDSDGKKMVKEKPTVSPLN
jgi:hypothetical protein